MAEPRTRLLNSTVFVVRPVDGRTVYRCARCGAERSSAGEAKIHVRKGHAKTCREYRRTNRRNAVGAADIEKQVEAEDVRWAPIWSHRVPGE